MPSSSSKPKGATSYKETAFGIIPRNKLTELEIEGIKKGLEYIQTLIEQDIPLKIDSQLICKLHAVSFGWIFPDWAGKYRTIQVTYSGKEAPSYFQIPELMHNLCEDLAFRLKALAATSDPTYISQVVSLLAWFQHRFVFIHPFIDYNGRTARLLTVLLLLQLKLPPIELKAETKADREKYLEAMQQADERDFTNLEDLIANALTESLTKITSE